MGRLVEVFSQEWMWHTQGTGFGTGFLVVSNICIGKEAPPSCLSPRGEAGTSLALLGIYFACFSLVSAACRTQLVRNTLPELLCLSKKRFRRRPRPLHHVFLMPRGLVAVAALVEEGRQWSAPLFHMRFRSVLLHEAQKVRPKALDVHRAVLMVVASGEEGLLNGRANGGAQKLRPLKGAL